MKELENPGTSAPAGSKLPLSREQFERICRDAASGSTGCAAYIDKVLANLLALLGGSEGLAPSPSGPGAKSENVQAAIIMLYSLVEQKSDYDFDVGAVLNAFDPDSALE